MIELTNFNPEATNAVRLPSGGEQTIIETRSLKFPAFTGRAIFSVETCIQIGLSLVKEVEAIFIDREGEADYKVISVINERDAAVREKIYAREEEVMRMYPTMRFDFHVLARMNRRLEDVITKANKTVFER